jgi:hypothetical protein
MLHQRPADAAPAGVFPHGQAPDLDDSRLRAGDQLQVAEDRAGGVERDENPAELDVGVELGCRVLGQLEEGA